MITLPIIYPPTGALPYFGFMDRLFEALKYIAILLLLPCVLEAQPNLETSVPANYVATGGTLSISSDHYRLGAQSLRWDWVAGDTLKITGLNLTNTFTWGINTFGAWVYNENPLPEYFKFHFINTSNALKFSFDYRVNFSGWRWAVQSYRFDMTKSNSASWTVKTIHIVAPATGSGTLFFDDFNYERSTVYATADNQMPYLPSNANYQDYIRPAVIPATPPTAQELSDLAMIRSVFLPANPFNAPTSTELNNAIAAYNNLNIVISGTQIKGNVISDPSQVGDMMMVFARDWWKNSSEPSRQRAENVMRLLLDGGMAGGSIAWGAGGSTGYDDRTFFTALKYFSNNAFPASLNAQIKDWMYWASQLGVGWQSKADQNGRHNTDNIHVLYDLYFNVVFFSATDAEKVQMLKLLTRYFEGFAQAQKGHSDGIKIDGPGYHHGSHHNSYMYAFSTFANPILLRLDKTSFQIDSTSYKHFRAGVIALDVSKNGGVYGNSLCGRQPFSVSMGFNAAQLSQLANIGGWILGKPYDTDLAAYRNRRFGVDPAFASTPLSAPVNGFWQMNYSPLGIYRQDSWLADIRGTTSYFWGTEIYDGANRYGRYQSFGAVEIIYNGGLAASGFQINGWNWNMPPGTTTVHLPFNLLNPPSARHDEYNDSPFSGALRMEVFDDHMQLQRGRYGVYGYKLQQRNYTNTSLLKARKSVFAIEGKLICLGTDISSPDNRGITATNLFQGLLSTTATPITVDGVVESTFPYSTTLAATNPHWFKDAAGTGYYVFPGSGDVQVARQAQTSPHQNGSGTTTSGNFASAYISHGVQPGGARYEYVVAPGISDAGLLALKDSLSNPALKFYEVRRQDSSAHILYLPKRRIEASVFFSANTTIDTGRVVLNSHPVLFISRMAGDTLYTSLANPDVNLLNETSQEKVIQLTLRGIWEVLRKDDAVTWVQSNASGTSLNYRTKDGLPLDAVLRLLPPSAKLIGVPAACAGTTPGNNGKLVMVSHRGADRYGLSAGTTYNGPSYSAAAALPAATPFDVAGNVPNTQSAVFTVRVFNGSDTVYIDYTVVVPAASMPCPIDPTGYVYCEESGKVISGGTISVSGPGAVLLTQNGNAGFYQFFTDGTPGTYSITYNPPQGMSASSMHLPLPAIDPSGQPNPYSLGSGSSDGLRIDDFSAAANPFTLNFELAPGDPDILLNNIPLKGCCVPPDLVLNTSSAAICRGSSFDLASVVGDADGGVLSYYVNRADAQSGNSSLASSVVMPLVAQHYYIRSQYASSCYSIQEFTLTMRQEACGGLIITGPN